MPRKENHNRKSLGSVLMGFVVAGSVVGVTFGVIVPNINKNLENLNPETVQQVSTMAAKDTFDKDSDEYFFKITSYGEKDALACIQSANNCPDLIGAINDAIAKGNDIIPYISDNTSTQETLREVVNQYNGISGKSTKP